MKITPRTKLGFEVTLTINECEARALDALAGYGIDAFLKVFYKHMGEAYMRPHEHGLRTLFDAIRNTGGLSSELARIDTVKRAISYAEQARLMDRKAAAMGR